MQGVFQRSVRIGLFCLLISVTFAPGTASAQSGSGSAGGSIGNDEKSLSGSRATPRAVESEKPARRSKPEAEEPRRAARKSGGGGGANSFDGMWVVTGVGVTCQGSSSNPIVITSGKIIGKTARGTVSSSGVVNGIAQGSGLTMITSGRLSGRSGGGTWRQSDGCTGTWTASKQ